ncbi:MAG: hypothetical protein K0R47_2273 [Brevibacillus sp.]|nr:hypothetical protein [Brevibacillus sp.]
MSACANSLLSITRQQIVNSAPQEMGISRDRTIIVHEHPNLYHSGDGNRLRRFSLSSFSCPPADLEKMYSSSAHLYLDFLIIISFNSTKINSVWQLLSCKEISPLTKRIIFCFWLVRLSLRACGSRCRHLAGEVPGTRSRNADGGLENRTGTYRKRSGDMQSFWRVLCRTG